MIKIKCPKCGCTFDTIEIHIPRVLTISYNEFYECPNPSCQHHIPVLSVACHGTWTGQADLIDSIEILINLPGTDKLCLHTHMPSPFPPDVSNDHLILSTEVQKGKALYYAVMNFPNKPINLIDCENGHKHWITEEERKKVTEPVCPPCAMYNSSKPIGCYKFNTPACIFKRT